MAETTGSVWAKPGAWALDAEEFDAADQQQKPNSDFPSLAAASVTKVKKKKAQALSLAEFAAYDSTAKPKGLTHVDLINLPTGPRERTAEDLDRSRLGGGFRSYGGNNRDESRWGSSRDSDESRREGGFNRDVSRESAPSRADEVDDWSRMKKITPPVNGAERRERDRDRGGFFGSQSKADESESWFASKTETRNFGTKLGANGGGFEKRGGSFDTLSRDGGDRKFSGEDNWGRNGGGGGGGGGGGERPRLVLQPRTLPVGDGGAAPVMEKLKGATNPFGLARPREEILAEKRMGLDEKLQNVGSDSRPTSAETMKEGIVA